jgi:hypothetical protein
MRDTLDGPTNYRLRHSEGFFERGGDKRVGHRFIMRDTPLARLFMRKKISGEEYSGLRRYALHWLAGGYGGHLSSVDLNRILAFDPGSMTGLAKSEAQANHRQEYRHSRSYIGTRPAMVADCVACFDMALDNVGTMLGYNSPCRGREKALSILRDAGYRLHQFWSK